MLAAKLKAQGIDCIFRVAGDGPLRNFLNSQLGLYGLNGKVQFLGYSDDIAGLLAEAKFLIHTSDTEGCPNAVLEAMACARAVVATDVGDIPSIVDDGRTGFVVPRCNENILLDRVVRLITDSDLCLRMGNAARAKAKREFGLDRFVKETFAVYRAIGWRDSQQ
jgi:glycosyltransferase involved in cell wall biosynthesis